MDSATTSTAHFTWRKKPLDVARIDLLGRFVEGAFDDLSVERRPGIQFNLAHFIQSKLAASPLPSSPWQAAQVSARAYLPCATSTPAPRIAERGGVLRGAQSFSTISQAQGIDITSICMNICFSKNRARVGIAQALGLGGGACQGIASIAGASGPPERSGNVRAPR